MDTQTTTDFAYKSIIEFSVVGAVLAIVLISAIALVWWVLRSSKAEIRDARNNERCAHAASIQMAEKTVGVNTQLVERLDRLIGMSNSIIRHLASRSGGEINDPSDAA